MKTHSNFYFFAVAIVALLILASCSNMIYSNKTSITLNLSNLDILRQAQNGGAYKIKCIVMDIDNHKTIADVEKKY